jgi:heme a synthase
MRAFSRFAWSVLAYNLFVVAWGAYVRATGSGAGCGRHWPTCNGEVVPRGASVETAIEFTHRATSGIALVLVVVLVAGAFRAFESGHPARRAAVWSLGLMLVEALLGAGLVLFGWVAKDESLTRGWVMALHLANTFLLLGALGLTAWWSTAPGRIQLRGRGSVAALLAAAFAATMLAGVSGAIAALGDTLFPATSFAAGFRAELSSAASVLLRLRIVHPFAALAAAAVLLLAARAASRARPEPRVAGAAQVLAALVVVQLAAGALNLALLAPVWMQLVHLLLADLVWLALVVLSAASLAPAAVESAAPVLAPPRAEDA